MARRPRKTDPAAQIVDAALAAAATGGWHRLDMRDIAAAAGLSLDQLYARYRTKGAILEAYVRRIDEAVLAASTAEGESARDRLFDVLMHRFEAMAPQRRGVAAVCRDMGRDPAATLCRLPGLGRSMAWMLEAASLSPRGCAGALRTAGLGAAYLGALRVWLDDDDPDMARTMKALDSGLRRAERAARLCAGLPRGRTRPVVEDEAPATG